MVAECGAGRTEADRHHGGEYRVVSARGRQPGEDEEPEHRDGAGQDQHPPDADAPGEPCTERSGREPDDALRGR